MHRVLAKRECVRYACFVTLVVLLNERLRRFDSGPIVIVERTGYTVLIA